MEKTRVFLLAACVRRQHGNAVTKLGYDVTIASPPDRETMTVGQRAFWLTVAKGVFPAKIGKYSLCVTDGDRALYRHGTEEVRVELAPYLFKTPNASPDALWWDPTDDEKSVVLSLQKGRSASVVARTHEEYTNARRENPLADVTYSPYESSCSDWDCIGFKERWGCD